MASFCIGCTVASDYKDLVIAACCEMGMQGCVEHDLAADEVHLELFFDEHVNAGEIEFRLFSFPLRSALAVTPVADEDWNKNWKATMQPVLVAPGVWAAPEWLPPPINQGEHWIKIEPKMAFGTGHHETTRLAATALLNTLNAYRPQRLLDIGTGSGILCFCADYAGVPFSLGLDIDDDCRQNLAENHALNAPRNQVHFLIGTPDALRTSASFDMVAMNMIFTHSTPYLGAIHHCLTDKGILVWSGILADEYQEAVDAALAAGFVLLTQSVEGEWWCGTFER